MTDPTLADVLLEVRALRMELAAALAPRPSRLVAADRDTLELLLPAIAAAAGDTLWTVGELVAHARIHGEAPRRLQEALSTVGGTKTVGKLLRRAVGVSVGGFVVERVGDDRGGALWRVCVGAERCERRRAAGTDPAHR